MKERRRRKHRKRTSIVLFSWEKGEGTTWKPLSINVDSYKCTSMRNRKSNKNHIIHNAFNSTFRKTKSFHWSYSYYQWFFLGIYGFKSFIHFEHHLLDYFLFPGNVLISESLLKPNLWRFQHSPRHNVLNLPFMAPWRYGFSVKMQMNKTPLLTSRCPPYPLTGTVVLSPLHQGENEWMDESALAG